jgi:hypothetical protein
MNQVPEKDILVRNQIQMYNKKYPVNTMWLLEQNKCRIKKNINWAAKKYYDIKTSCFNLAITLILFV